MAGFLSLGTLFFILMLGASYSYPTRKDSDSQDGGSNTNSSTGVYVPRGSGFFEGEDQDTPFGPMYSQQGVGEGLVLYSGLGGADTLGGPVMENKGPTAIQGSPDSSYMAPGSGPGEVESGAGDSRFDGLGPRNHKADPAGPGGPYQLGDLSHMQNIFEDEDHDIEPETQDVPFQQPGFFGPNGPESALDGASDFSLPYYPDYNVYPYYEYLLRTGQHPPGTLSRLRSTFEQGEDYWHDTNYNKYHDLPVGDQQVNFPIMQQQTVGQA